jgi:hypothetical protein
MTADPPPWKKKTPRKGRPLKLTEAQKQEARTRAAKAGRRYPNLIDNMYVARRAKTGRPK